MACHESEPAGKSEEDQHHTRDVILNAIMCIYTCK